MGYWNDRGALAKGFTLIELLLVSGILVILLAITLVALNPARQFAQSNNVKRTNDVNTISNAIHQYAADSGGVLDGLGIVVDNVPHSISNTGAVGEADVCAALVPQYIAALPVDPQVDDGEAIAESGCTGAYETGYEVSASTANNTITVIAPSTELLGAPISVTR